MKSARSGTLKVLNISYFYSSKLLSSAQQVYQFGTGKYCLYLGLRVHMQMNS